ncbi:MAG TPA: D-cysteine desulfhydrase family protein [Vicinamibacterales bacterium]|nr:D-cysteine desulfhydrase family protein [Vicinamibacterales bacterium]
MATALAALMGMPAISLAPHATPIDELSRLREAVGGGHAPRLLMKRDDLLSFGGGGNKIRKLQTVIAEARAAGGDTLITCGGLQSNHARATAAAGAALGLPVVLVLNGEPPRTPTANTRLDLLFGAEVRYVPNREARVPTMQAVAEELRGAGRRPVIVPIGASTATGALGFARGVAEILAAGIKPDVIVHSTSSGGTQAGIVAGCRLFGLAAKVIGVSADEPADELRGIVRRLIAEMATRLGVRAETIGADDIDVDDTQVGQGYGIPTRASTEALELAARSEGILLDPVYTAKAMAGLIARVRGGVFRREMTILFWHTGGQIGFFA